MPPPPRDSMPPWEHALVARGLLARRRASAGARVPQFPSPAVRPIVGARTSAVRRILLRNSVLPSSSMSASTKSGGFLFPLLADGDAGLVSFGLWFGIFASHQAGFRFGGEAIGSSPPTRLAGLTSAWIRLASPEKAAPPTTPSTMQVPTTRSSERRKLRLRESAHGGRERIPNDRGSCSRATGRRTSDRPC